MPNALRLSAVLFVVTSLALAAPFAPQAARQSDGALQPASRPGAARESVAALARRDGRPLTVAYDPAAGNVTFLMGGRLYAPGPAARGDAVAAAFEFLARYPGLYGLRAAPRELRVLRVTGDALGQQHVRLSQQLNGVPVFGRSLYVHLDAQGHVLGTNGHFVPGLTLATTPRLAAPTAERLARTAAARPGAVHARPTALAVYVDAPGGPRLTWKVDVFDRGGAFREWLFIDAHSGALVAEVPTLATDREREIYDAENQESLPGELIGREGEIPDDEAGASAYEFIGQVYDYYREVHGRDSFDGDGAPLIVTVHYSRDYNWNFWDGEHIVFGDPDPEIRGASGAFALDVVAHETTHAVVEYTADLIYQDMSGALNESFADVFGAMLDREDWHYSEDTPYGSWYPTPWAHDLEDPTLGGSYDPDDPYSYGQPAKMSDFADWPSTREWDWGGVHTNGGITSHAAYLVAQALGGDVEGRVPVEHIWYRALSVYLTENSDFWDFAQAIRQSAEDLEDRFPGAPEAVEEALAAVELAGDPPTEPTATPRPSATPRRGGGTPQPDATPAQGCRELIVNGGFENRAPDPWVEHSGADFPLITADRPHTGRQGLWLGGLDEGEAFQYVYQDVAIPANARAVTLSYWHQVEARTSDDPQGETAFQTVLADTRGNIIADLETLTARGAGGWQQTTIDLADYAGDSVRLAFTASIAVGDGSSLFVDDVALQACTGRQGRATPTPRPGQGITVGGRVIDADSGRGISGAGVYVLIPGLKASDAVVDKRVSASEIFTYAFADEDGRFELVDPLAPSTSYSAVVIMDGYYAVVADDAIDTSQWEDGATVDELVVEMTRAR